MGASVVCTLQPTPALVFDRPLLTQRLDYPTFIVPTAVVLLIPIQLWPAPFNLLCYPAHAASAQRLYGFHNALWSTHSGAHLRHVCGSLTSLSVITTMGVLWRQHSGKHDVSVNAV
eukprot:Blabericola_migrator_1__1973@NODE_1539_length_4318_cov_16_186544_g1012_i0_p2_GENE_NODE_1539_length_4318_cov_16_186544_g1012_i0NODE_1539_length_4318_cov_16_186544_g1012_i0_p2_ORF_typecomplete_len116_score2_50_NODE_1539_length_4318_cov_16_186544_g1012_i010241371